MVGLAVIGAVAFYLRYNLHRDFPVRRLPATVLSKRVAEHYIPGDRKMRPRIAETFYVTFTYGEEEREVPVTARTFRKLRLGQHGTITVQGAYVEGFAPEAAPVQHRRPLAAYIQREAAD